MDSIMGTKKKKKAAKKTEVIQIRIEVAKPGSKKYTHVDFEDLLKSQGKEKDEDALRRFYDEDTLNMHKKLGEMKTKSGKSLRVDLEYLLHMNRNAGYDMDDEFIDDSEAVDGMAITSKKGGFYVGKGDVKAVDEEEEEEEESEDEEEVVQKKPRKRKEKPGSSSSDSEDSEPVRMTGAPPMGRMTGAPPTKKLSLMKRPSPSTPKASDDKKKSSESSSATSEDEPPPKKKAVEVIAAASASTPAPSVSIVEAAEVSPPKAPAPTPAPTASGAPVTPVTPATSTTTSPAKDSRENVTAVITNMFTQLNKKGKEFQKLPKGSKLDSATVEEIREFFRIPKHHKMEKFNVENLKNAVANIFGMNVEALDGYLNTHHVVHIKKEPSSSTSSSSAAVAAEPVTVSAADWKLTKTDLPTWSEVDISNMTTIVKSWRSMKQVPISVITAWLKEVNSSKLTPDLARQKLFEVVRILPDLDKPTLPDTNVDLPKHERSRKARMFLPQWIWLSRKYVEGLLPKLKKPATDGYAKKQQAAAVALKEAMKKQMTSFEQKREKPTDVYQFQFTEPVLAAMWTYLDELADYSLSIGKLDIIVHGMDSLHQALDNKITLIQFYFELCRRFQKLSFLIVEEPMKTRLANANAKELIHKTQVVQNVKYVIRWPDNNEPSMRGLNHDDLHSYDTSILANWKPQPSPGRPAAVHHHHPTSSSSSTPTTSSSTSKQSVKPATTPLATRQPTDDERRAMNTIVQVYLGKYLLANGTSKYADICNPNVLPMSDELLIAMITAVHVCGVPVVNHMIMYKNILAHVGQLRMAQAVNGPRADSLVTKQYQALFDYFSKYEKAMDAKRLKESQKEKESAEERERKKQEERMKKEREKEKKEAEKREEKERKEREKREEKERKEKEQREAVERRRQEEEDRRKAQEAVYRQMEDARRKKEAEQAVEKEMERRARLETEAASALQGLEEDNLMDDVDFVAEQQSREDEERKNAEAQRAVERENQIKMMRAHKAKNEPPPTPAQAPPPIPIPEQLQIPQEPGMEQFRDRSEAPEAPQIPRNPENQASSESNFQIQQVPNPVAPTQEQQIQQVPEQIHQTPVIQNPQMSQIQNQNAQPPVNPQPQMCQMPQIQNQMPPIQNPQVAQAPVIQNPPNHQNNPALFHPEVPAPLLQPFQHEIRQELRQDPLPQNQPMENGNCAENPNLKRVKLEPPSDPSFDILNAAQEAAGLTEPPVNVNVKLEHVEPERRGGAFDKLASLRGRTMSADVRRMSENVQETPLSHFSGIQNPQGLQNPSNFNGSLPNTPYTGGPSTSQHFFPNGNGQEMMIQQQQQQQQMIMHHMRQEQMLQEQDMRHRQEVRQQHVMRMEQEARQQEESRRRMEIGLQQEQRMRQEHEARIRQEEQKVRQQQMRQEEQRMRQQEEQRMRQQEDQRMRQEQQRMRQQQEARQQQMRQEEERRRQQEALRMRQQQEMQQRQMQMAQQQQQRMMNAQMNFSRQPSNQPPPQAFPIPTYQSPNHHNITNSSVMHTPLSNGSMVGQSPQFSSHPSPMSQQFHTPPSVGMLNNSHQIINSPVQQQLQHFNFPPQNNHNNYQQHNHQQQMHRQLSQHQMQQAHPQQPHPMMRQHNPNNYPPQ